MRLSLESNRLPPVIHHHRNLVCVRRKHDARAAAFVENRDAVAVGTGKCFVGKFFGEIQLHALAARLVPDGAWCVDKGF